VTVGDVVVAVIAVASGLAVLGAIAWWVQAAVFGSEIGLGAQLLRWLASGAVAAAAVVVGVLVGLSPEACVLLGAAAGSIGPPLVLALRPRALAASRRRRRLEGERLRLDADREDWVRDKVARGEPLRPEEERWMQAAAPELDPELLAAEEGARSAEPTSWEIWSAEAELRRRAEEGH
jgi:hypothetical protein